MSAGQGSREKDPNTSNEFPRDAGEKGRAAGRGQASAGQKGRARQGQAAGMGRALRQQVCPPGGQAGRLELAGSWGCSEELPGGGETFTP